LEGIEVLGRVERETDGESVVGLSRLLVRGRWR
jgi:hypothetical protein